MAVVERAYSSGGRRTVRRGGLPQPGCARGVRGIFVSRDGRRGLVRGHWRVRSRVVDGEGHGAGVGAARCPASLRAP
eukprot:11162407-Lingulodinium_polyedra.AAC.1